MTFAPKSARNRAAACPIPRDAPVTSAVFPFRLNPSMSSAPRRVITAQSLLTQFLAGDGSLVDFVGAVGDAHCAQVRPESSERRIFGQPEAAVDLNRPIDHSERDTGSVNLDRGDLR